MPACWKLLPGAGWQPELTGLVVAAPLSGTSEPTLAFQFPGTVTYAVLMPPANWNQLGFFKSPFIQRADIFCALFWSWFELLKIIPSG